MLLLTAALEPFFDLCVCLQLLTLCIKQTLAALRHGSALQSDYTLTWFVGRAVTGTYARVVTLFLTNWLRLPQCSYTRCPVPVVLNLCVFSLHTTSRCLLCLR